MQTIACRTHFSRFPGLRKLRRGLENYEELELVNVKYKESPPPNFPPRLANEKSAEAFAVS